MRFKGKVALVTGGASGIGLAAARRFHKDGAAVVIADINAELGQQVVENFGDDRAAFVTVDVAAWESVEGAVAQAIEKFGGLDILFNNAGIGSFATTPNLTTEEWRRVIAINLDGVFNGCKAAIPAMRTRGGGAIINTASASGLAADYAFAAYNAAKGAVINYTRAVAIDHAREGIRANVICPGPVQTPIMSTLEAIPGVKDDWVARVPVGRFAQPEEVANVAAFLASDEASYIIGAVIAVDGGLTAHTGQPNLPRLLEEL